MTVQLYRDVYTEIFLHLTDGEDQLAFAQVNSEFYDIFRRHVQVTEHDLNFASTGGHLDVVRWMVLDRGIDAGAHENYPIRWASREGHLDVVQFLAALPGVDPTLDHCRAMMWASEKGHLDVVRFLWSFKSVKKSAMRKWMFIASCAGGQLESAKFWLPLMDEEDVPFQELFAHACQQGFLELAKWLLTLPRVDAGGHDNLALVYASKSGETESVKWLLTLPSVVCGSLDYAMRCARRKEHHKTVAALRPYLGSTSLKEKEGRGSFF